MPKKKRLTFFTPTMARTGSEIVLFNLLNKINNQFKVVVIANIKGGVLLDLLPSTMERKFLHKKLVKYNFPITSYTLKTIFERYYPKIILVIKAWMYKNAGWYVNTITLPEVIEYAEKHKIKLIVHVHEGEPFLKALKKDELKRLIDYPALIIANSNNTAKMLADYGRVDGVEICYPAINTKEISKDKSAYLDFRQQLGIAENKFLWVMSGSLDKNKNPFLFIDTASEVLKTWPNAMFMWIGADDNELLEGCKKRTDELELEGKIIWTENKGTDYYKYFNCADGFVLTSIRESFSLVTVEALLFGLPIVAMDCGGVREILQDDMGQIIEQGNSAQLMARAMINYMSGKLMYDADKEKQRAKKFDIEVMAAKWNQLLTNYFKLPG